MSDEGILSKGGTAFGTRLLLRCSPNGKLPHPLNRAAASDLPLSGTAAAPTPGSAGPKSSRVCGAELNRSPRC